MSTWRWRCLALGIALAALVGVFALTLQPEPARSINKATHELIQEGMTEAEVECIFGLPAGDYSTKLPPGPRKLIQNRHKELAGLHYGIWASDYGIIVVYFDDAKKVDGAVFYPSFVRSDPTMLERIRGWLSAR